MGFYGEIVSKDELEFGVPDAYALHLSQACVVFDDEKEPPSPRGHITTVFMKTANNDEESYVICHLNKTNILQCPLNLIFGPEDSPISLWTNGGRVSITGRWTWELDDDGDDECGIEGHEHDDTCGNQELSSGENEIKRAIPEEASIMRKRNRREGGGDNDATTAVSIGDDDECPNLVPISTHTVIGSVEAKSSTNKVPNKWKVKPLNDEGILVPKPKQLLKGGVKVTDYVVGHGSEPKLGSKVKIIYEGFFPDLTIFDANMKRSKPFVFRKGTGQVIKGLDLGLEGMRVGGSRELVIPSELGYGAKGLGEIPGGQTLLFRITLVE